MSEKSKKFKDLAEKRVNAVLDKLRLIGNLSDTRYYEYTKEDSGKIISAIRKEINEIDLKFKAKNKIEKKFKL